MHNSDKAMATIWPQLLSKCFIVNPSQYTDSPAARMQFKHICHSPAIESMQLKLNVCACEY